MGLDKETVGFDRWGTYIGGDTLRQESSANETLAYAVAIHPVLISSDTTINLITTFQIPGIGMNSLNASTAEYKWRRAPLLMGGDGGGVGGE